MVGEIAVCKIALHRQLKGLAADEGFLFAFGRMRNAAMGIEPTWMVSGYNLRR